MSQDTRTSEESDPPSPPRTRNVTEDAPAPADGSRRVVHRRRPAQTTFGQSAWEEMTVSPDTSRAIESPAVQETSDRLRREPPSADVLERTKEQPAPLEYAGKGKAQAVYPPSERTPWPEAYQEQTILASRSDQPQQTITASRAGDPVKHRAAGEKQCIYISQEKKRGLEEEERRGRSRPATVAATISESHHGTPRLGRPEPSGNLVPPFQPIEDYVPFGDWFAATTGAPPRAPSRRHSRPSTGGSAIERAAPSISRSVSREPSRRARRKSEVEREPGRRGEAGTSRPGTAGSTQSRSVSRSRRQAEAQRQRSVSELGGPRRHESRSGGSRRSSRHHTPRRSVEDIPPVPPLPAARRPLVPTPHYEEANHPGMVHGQIDHELAELDNSIRLTPMARTRGRSAQSDRGSSPVRRGRGCGCCLVM